MVDKETVTVIGAGIGGLAAAAALARQGLTVNVLEAHVYPGGCAGTFFHQGYRFEAGATLAGGFYPGGPMDLLAKAANIPGWPSKPADQVMEVHLSDGKKISVWGDERRHAVRHAAYGVEDIKFWKWQEQAASVLWDLALRLPPWPPQSTSQLMDISFDGLAWLAANFHKLPPFLLIDAFRPVGARLHGVSMPLRQFVDAQLLIASQTTSQSANALYGAAALDLPRRGVVHLYGGVGAIANVLVESIRRMGGSVHFRQEVTRIHSTGKGDYRIETRRGLSLTSRHVLANLPPWNIKKLISGSLPNHLRNLSSLPADGWGAFMLYLGVENAVIPSDSALHHQVIASEPLGEGNSIFISISPPWDDSRAPAGHRAITISTHTRLQKWWQLFESDRDEYDKLRIEYASKLITVAEKALPGLRQAVRLSLPGTPVTFQRFTRRHLGWVGGFPQTNLFRLWGPRLGQGLWMVGDSIFPGQSIAASALGGMRVARNILQEYGIKNDQTILDSHLVDSSRFAHHR